MAEADREDIPRVLREAGYQVETTPSGAAALLLCRQRRFAAITVDALLPDHHGHMRREGLRAAAAAPGGERVVERLHPGLDPDVPGRVRGELAVEEDAALDALEVRVWELAQQVRAADRPEGASSESEW